MSTGQLVARANSDSTLVQALLNYLPLISANVMLMVLSLGVMIYLSPLLAVVSVVVLPGLGAVSYVRGGGFRQSIRFFGSLASARSSSRVT
jgi:ATP-binding cassette subfamily B protein